MKTLKRCRKATVYDDEKNLLSQASVFLDEEENLMLVMPREFEYQRQEEYEIIFFDPVMGLIPCRCSFRPPQPLSEDMDAFECIVHERGEQIQRRMDIKVPVEIDINIKSQNVVGGQAEVSPDGYPAVMKDISAGGTYIVSKVWVEAGTLVTFDFPYTKIPIVLTAEVLRVVEMTNEEGEVEYGHGCRFEELSRSTESQLRNFVYQKERELYKNDIW